MAALAFDILLAAGLVYVAWRALGVRDAFTAVVLFIAFGLLMALCWVRLDAPDIALAEAAIGAGLTGALLLDALGHTTGGRLNDAPQDDDPPAAGPGQRALIAILSVGGGAAVAAGLWFLPTPSPAIQAPYAAALDAHPVSNAVTAVLLDLRAYDTFLEMGVLALAALGALMLRATGPAPRQALPPARTSRLLPGVAGVLVPFMMLVAVYLYWAGTGRSGGAFPAGAMLAAAGVLLFLTGSDRLAARDDGRWRAVLGLGLAAFLIAGGAGTLGGAGFLGWPAGWTYVGILILEGVLTLAIGGMLLALYTADAQPPREPSQHLTP